ncbi:DUF7305 domain-containing protein [Viridibacillus sp. FSL H8-0110]|uniref:DUF7305 domain-containing protein n=1 Tax=Viridibacillus sp. FSL H8-0110 TaxID=2921376 RepID=UPI0030F7CC0E
MRKLYKHNHTLKNENGYTLIIVLMVLVVMSILGVSLMSVTATTMKQSSGERTDQSVYYIAEAGIVQKREELNNKVNDAFISTKNHYETLTTKEKLKFNFTDYFYTQAEQIIASSTVNQFSNYEEHFGKKPKSTIILTKDKDDSNKYYIKSTGEIGGKKRTVTQEYIVYLVVETTPTPETYTPKYAVHVKNTISLSGSANIYGADIATESSNPGSIDIPAYYGHKPKADLSTPIDIELPSFPEDDFKNLEQLKYPNNELVKKNDSEKTNVIQNGDLLINHYLTNKYTLNMTNNMKFKNIILSSNYSLTINVGNTDKSLLVDHLNIDNGHINIIGSGKLTIYVKDKITTNSSSTVNNNGSISKLKVYYKGNNAINMAGDQRIFGSLYAKNANIKFGGSGGFQGDIYSGGSKVELDGASSAITKVFFAPNADVTLSGSGNITGAVIAKSFTASGGSYVQYASSNPIPIETVPSYDDPKQLSSQGALIEE